MVNETLQTIQAKLSELALSLPQLQKTGHWSEILRELAGLLRSTHRQELLLETVAAISDAASSILEVDDLLRVAVNLIQDYFDLYYVGIFLTDEANEWAVLRAATGQMGQRLLEGKHQLRINDQSLIGWSIYHRQSQIALDVDEVIYFHSPLLPETRSEMILPLINRGQVIGALDVQSEKLAAFTQEDITLFQTLADQLANTIQNAQLFTENTRLLDQAENSRRFLKTVIEHIPDSIFIKDKSHTLIEMNQANAQVIGQPQPELLGKTDRDFFPPELADLFYQRDNEVFATNQIVATEDKTIWGDGHEHIAHTRLIPIPNSAGQPEYLLGISQDVTEERAREAERERLLAETAALYLGGQAIASALSERQIFEAIFEQIRHNDPCEISAFRFYMVDNEPTWAELRLNWQKRDNPSYAVGTRLYLPEVPQRELLARGSALFMDDIATDDRLSNEERASFVPTGACSAAILPLIVARQQLGAISVYFTTPHLFTEEMQRLWLAMADQVGIALTNRLLIEEAAYRATRMETAAEVARAASSILEVQELLNSAVALICDRFNLYYVGAFLVDEAKEWAVLTAGTGEAGQIQLQKQHRLKIGGESMIGWSVYHRQPRIALDVGKEAVRFQNPDLPQTRSEIALPLIYHHEVIGALTVQSEEQAAFSREDIIVLQTMADQLANAVVNARLYQQAQQEIGERKKAEAALEIRVEARTAELREVNEQLVEEIAERRRAEEALQQNERRLRRQNETLVGLASTRAKVLDQENLRIIFAEITEATAHTLEVERTSVWLYDEAHSKISCVDLYELSLNRHSEGVELAEANYPAYFKALAEEHTIAAHDAHTDPRTRDFSESYLTPMSITSMLDAPIWVGGRMVGVICHEHTGPARLWSIEEQNFAGSMADMVALAMEAHERKRAEIALQQAYDKLDIRVQERTAELAKANAILKEQIVERQRAEEALRASEALYQSLVDNIPQNVFRKDRGGRFVFGNRSFCNSLNVTLDELIGQTDFDVYPAALAEKYSQDDQKVLETGEITETVEESLPSAGHKIYVRMVKSPIFDPSGEIVGTQGIFWDITERKQAEEARQKALARTQLLYNISEALATLINRRAAFETVLGEYLLLLNRSQGRILLIDPAGEYNTLEALYIDGKVVEPELIFPAQEDLITQYLQKNPFPLVIEDVSIHPLTRHNQAVRGQVEAMLFIPITTRGDVVGIMGADATEKDHIFTPDDIEIGKAIADQLAIWLDNHQLLTEAQYRSERLQTAAEVSSAASSILDVNDLINTSVNLIRDQFNFYYVGLFMVNEAREWAVLQGGTGEAGRIQIANEHKLKIGGESMIGWCIQNRQARIALDVGQEDVRFRNPVLPDTHSEMALPLKSRDEVIGALTVQSTEHNAFSAEDITLLQTMADQLANAIQNARLFESATQARQEAEALLKDTQALQQFSQMLAGTLQAPEILDIFFNACAQVIGFDYAQFCLVDKYQGRVRAIAGFGISESLIKRSNQALDSQDIMADIVRTGHTEILTGWDDRFDRKTFEAEKHINWVRVFTPVSLRQENIGLVEAGFNKNANQAIEQAHVKLLRAFIDQTALALDNAQRYEASQKAARREALIKEITTKVRSSTNVDTILQTTVKELGDALSSKRTYVHLVSPVNPGETN
jgi:PAS domain S-box-containing protein